MFSKQTINTYDISNKRVLLRADFNVPVKDGKVVSDYRIRQSLPTIQKLIESNCKIVIIAHLGRPNDKNDKQFSLKPEAKVLSKLLNQPVLFAADCIGKEAESAAANLKGKEILLLENLRFYDEEKKNDKSFAKQLVKTSNAEVFVQDGFGIVHRAHASTDAVARELPAVAGHLLEQEVSTINRVMSDPEKPLMAVIGGAKIADKIDIIKKFISLADIVVVGGAMANTFFKAQGHEVGKSLVDDDEIDTALEVIELAKKESNRRKFTFYLPQDCVVAKDIDSKSKTRIVDWDTRVVADIEAYPANPSRSSYEVAKDELILDIGPYSSAFIVGAMQLCNTVVWNGTMGVTETRALNDPVGPFAHGTQAVIDGLVGHYGNRPFSLLGGGDTTGYIENRDMHDLFNHVSTGGGASLDLMSGRELPGVSVLWDK